MIAINDSSRSLSEYAAATCTNWNRWRCEPLQDGLDQRRCNICTYLCL